MHALDLDFYRQAPASRWTGRVLLVAAIAFSAHLIYSYQHLEQTIAQQKEQLARLPKPRDAFARAEAASRNISPAEIAFARETIERLSTPWNELFTALESVRGERVALLSIEPDSRAGTVAIAAEARSYAQALDYVSQLRRGTRLTNVNLVKHEMRPDGAQKTVAFFVSASWKEARP
jgi:Tfp pilus assembly protein PilN